MGKKGKYEIKNYLGGGGNGKVYEVDVIEERGLPQQSNGFAIKVFDIIPRNEDDPEYKKRRTRFLKEIKKCFHFKIKSDLSFQFTMHLFFTMKTKTILGTLCQKQCGLIHNVAILQR